MALLCICCFRRYLWLLICLTVFMLKPAQASTLLFSHEGAANPTTEGWTFSGTVQTGAITDDLGSGVDAWKVYEQGGSNSGTYNKTLTTGQLSEALQIGWTLDATIRFVPPDPLVATSLGNNAWCTLLIDEGVTGKRDLYGLYFGNDISGNTLVRLYATGATYTLDPGYHDYRISWDPTTQLASFFIDGVLRASDYAGSTIDNTGTSRVYWGDNTTTAITPGRGAHYAYVGLSSGVAAVPEPGRAGLLLLAAAAGLFRRRR